MPPPSQITHIYRMTHLENIPHIFEHGLTHYQSPNMNPDYVPIGDGTLIQKRVSVQIPGGSMLGEYLPFYFGVRMPMLYVIQNGFNGVHAVNPSNIVYCVVSIKSIVLDNFNFMFTDGHAVDGLTSFYDPSRIDEIDNIVDSKAVNSKYWRDDTDLDLKRRKEAEFLILGDVPPNKVMGFLTYSDETMQSIMQMDGFGKKKIFVRPDCYF